MRDGDLRAGRGPRRGAKEAVEEEEEEGEEEEG